MENETRQDLGYQGNTSGNTQKYQLQKGLRMQNAPESSQPEPSALCRVRFKWGDMAGDVKKLAWEYAEPLLKHGKAEWIGWEE